MKEEDTANGASTTRESERHQRPPGNGVQWEWSSLPITSRIQSGLSQKSVTAPLLSYALCCFAAHYSPPKNLGARPNWIAISILHPGGRHGLRPAEDVGCTEQCASQKRSPHWTVERFGDNFDATLAVAGRFRAAVAIGRPAAAAARLGDFYRMVTTLSQLPLDSSQT